jgi:adenosyl cobinamide kinase/adenosyl cobinamide phosphate guanylyltransferase
VPALHRSHFILGGARSGKSRYALALAQADPRPTAFVATAPAGDSALAARIARHRAERPASWATVEEPWELAAACRRLVGRHELAVVDCLTLWVSNLILRGDDDAAILGAADDLAKLVRERVLAFILVSNEVGSGVHPPTPLGLRFADLLGEVNRRVAGAADRVTLMVAGIPLPVKDAPSPSRAHEHPPEAP